MPARVLILGGGFGGIYAALGLDKHAEVEVTLVSRDNFFLFTPMLSEVASSSIDTRHIVSPIRRLFKTVRFVEAEVESIDFDGRAVTVCLPSQEQQRLPYDHLVIALGSVSTFFGLPGAAEHALPVKTLADAIRLRNHVIQRLEEADVTSGPEREARLTFVIVGGGLAGVEVTGDLNDFVREALHAYPSIRPDEVRVILLEAGPRLMAELSAGLGEFARQKLTQRGVTVELDAAVESATHDEVRVKGRGAIRTTNLIWTAGVAPTPFVQHLGIPLEKHRIPTDICLRVPDLENVWALGDVARIPNGHGGYHPPTAQHAIREGRRAARNILRVVAGEEPAPFHYRTIGMLSTVGHRAGAGEVFGLHISGLPAWFMWRTYYLFRLPRLEKRIRVMLDWTLDLVFPRDIVQLKMDSEGGDRS